MDDALIIGAGLSGLRAATRLAERGLSVRVLEARDRVGGRTLTREFSGARLDLGGQWMGPTQTRLAALAGELGLQTFPTAIDGIKVLERARGVGTYRGAIPALPLLQLPELHFLFKRTDTLMNAVPVDRPDRAKHARDWDSETVESWKRRRIRGPAVREMLDVFVRAVFGAEPAELSVLHFFFYLRTGGGLLSLAEADGGAQQTRFVEGTQTFSERLAAQLGDRVTLSAPVRRLTTAADGVVAQTDVGEFRARRAVVAIPPTLAGRVEYDPPLPAARDALTQRTPMGATTKCLAFYDRPFWREAGRSGEIVSSLGPVSFTYDNSPPRGAPHNLVAFVVGDAARRFAGQPDALRAAVLEQLARLLGAEAARPNDFVVQDWATEPWTRGCPVALFAPATWTATGDALRAPCGLIHWAGTETATEWCGYLEGALQAGERAAEEVAAALA